MAFVIDQQRCSCCHRCRVECPSDAIHFKNSKYWIDPELCVSCGHCADVCHNEAVFDPENPAPAPAPHEPVEKSCDVVVIGGGAAGTAAAARAAASGKKVILLEKGKEVGGSATFAHMFRAHYSKWHKENGFADERDKTTEDFVRNTEGKVDGKLFRNILDANVDLVDWLIAEHDLGKDYVFDPEGPFRAPGIRMNYIEPYNAKKIDTTIGPGGTGWYMTNKLAGICAASGGEILYHTRAEHLILDENGAVCGVEASDGGGIIRIACKSVVVAAGAFTHNREIMSKMQPIFYRDDGSEPVHVFTSPNATGDGITMCDEIGADIDYENRRVNLFGPARHPYPCVTLNISRGRGGFKYLSNGEVFEDKGMGEVSALAYDPQRICWQVVDSNIVRLSLEDARKDKKDFPNIQLEKSYDRWEEFVEDEIACGSIVKADTLEELGEKLGFADPKAFAESVHYENEHPRPTPPPPPGFPGFPPPMPVTEAPFYALKLKLFHENAVGGMKTDSDLNVLKEGKPIPGLYACGDNIRGIMLAGDIGVRYIEDIVSALTFALSSGYMAGCNAVKFSES